MSRPIAVLFVCMGNICRSPMAENMFRHVVREAGVEDAFFIDSAGTSSWHSGEKPDARMMAVARRRGVPMQGSSRGFVVGDFKRFDHILVMDQENLDNILARAKKPDDADKVRLLREFDPEAGPNAEVPDPYYGGEEGFETVFEQCERSCKALLEALLADHD